MVYNQISKGGTNQFHGMGYDYFKNTALNAAPFGFNGVAGVRTPIHFNDFGGNIGGPVIKNRVFFFFALENTINHTTPPVSFATVPTIAMRSGNFAGMNTIYDPTSQTVNPTTGVVTRQPFLNNQIPAAMLDPVAKNIQAYYPLPNRAGQVVWTANNRSSSPWNRVYVWDGTAIHQINGGQQQPIGDPQISDSGQVIWQSSDDPVVPLLVWDGHSSRPITHDREVGDPHAGLWIVAIYVEDRSGDHPGDVRGVEARPRC